MALKKYSHRRRRSPWNFPIDEVTSYQTKPNQTKASYSVRKFHRKFF